VSVFELCEDKSRAAVAQLENGCPAQLRRPARTPHPDHRRGRRRCARRPDPLDHRRAAAPPEHRTL